MENVLNKKSSYSRKNINSISLKGDSYKNIINNNLIIILLQKKENAQKSVEKNDYINNKKF